MHPSPDNDTGPLYTSKVVAENYNNRTSKVNQVTNHHVTNYFGGQLTIVLCLGGTLAVAGLVWKVGGSLWNTKAAPASSVPGALSAAAPTIIVNPVQNVTVTGTTATQSQGTTLPAASPVLPDTLSISFDRVDRLYHDGDKQALRITVPRRGYLYVASIWADGQARLLCHPEWLQPVPGPVQAGQVVEIPVVNMSFTPPKPDDLTTAEEVRAILSEAPLPTLPADRKADVSRAWRECGFPITAPSLRFRGGELPEPELTRSSSGVLQVSAPYLMLKGPRPSR